LLAFFLGAAACACSKDANSSITLSLITAFIFSPFAEIGGSRESVGKVLRNPAFLISGEACAQQCLSQY
jgi:hypothetical protein